jgi:hypothetical protein
MRRPDVRAVVILLQGRGPTPPSTQCLAAKYSQDMITAYIDAEPAVRHAQQRYRRAGGRTTRPTPFHDQDRERFRAAPARLPAEGSAPAYGGGPRLEHHP